MESQSQCNDSHMSLPAPAQVALALVVLRSKPAEAPVEDYLTQLRDRIVVGCPLTRNPTGQYIDGVAYWKKACEKAEEEKAALLDKLYDLEKEKATVTLLSSPGVRSPLAQGGKRKREGTPAAKANSRSKRKTNPSKALQSSAKDETSTQNGDALLVGDVFDPPTNFLQAVFALRMHLKSQPLAPSAVQASARRLCHTVSAVIKTVGPPMNLDENSSDEHASVCRAIRRTYPTLMDAIELLQMHPQDSGGPETVIAGLAKTLSEMLRCLQSLAMQEQSTTRQVQGRTHSHDDNNHILELTNLISAMITELDLTKPIHRELFDGLLCTFFEYLGSNLSLAVFSEPMAQGLLQPPGLLDPCGLSAGPGDDSQVDPSGKLKVAPYLITILRKVKPCMNKRGNMDGEGCARAVIDKMQNTLLRALFGGQDLAFWNKLRLPAEVESVENEGDLVIDGEEHATREWFIGEVWNNVGWRILTQHIS